MAGSTLYPKESLCVGGSGMETQTRLWQNISSGQSLILFVKLVILDSLLVPVNQFGPCFEIVPREFPQSWDHLSPQKVFFANVISR